MICGSLFKIFFNIDFVFSFCSVFDVDDGTIPLQFRNGYTFLNPDEQVGGVNMLLLHMSYFFLFLPFSPCVCVCVFFFLFWFPFGHSHFGVLSYQFPRLG